MKRNDRFGWVSIVGGFKSTAVTQTLIAFELYTWSDCEFWLYCVMFRNGVNWTEPDQDDTGHNEQSQAITILGHHDG